MRVVSLLPSATELLAAIPGGLEMLVGRSHECDFPPGVHHLPALTSQRLPHDLAAPADIDRAVRDQLKGDADPARSLYTLDEELLASLKPDLVLTQDLCHVCSIDLTAVRSVVSRLPSKPDGSPAQILSLNPETIEGVFDDLLRVGEAIGKPQAALDAVVAFRGRMWRAIDHVNPYDDGPPGVVLDWTDPLFVAGHWTPQIAERAGARHPLNPTVPVENAGAAVGPQQTARRAGKSIAIPHDVLVAVKPEWIVLAPCGVPLRSTRTPHTPFTVEDMLADLETKPWWHELPAVRAGRVALVDGNQMFSRPGPRLIDALEWMTAWLNNRPELIPAGFPWTRAPGSLGVA
jgi:ABC-type Fe3+-hydroxamate transport system substrate-binding protein